MIRLLPDRVRHEVRPGRTAADARGPVPHPPQLSRTDYLAFLGFVALLALALRPPARPHGNTKERSGSAPGPSA
jgi:hypothetical protein